VTGLIFAAKLGLQQWVHWLGSWGLIRCGVPRRFLADAGFFAYFPLILPHSVLFLMPIAYCRGSVHLCRRRDYSLLLRISQHHGRSGSSMKMLREPPQPISAGPTSFSSVVCISRHRRYIAKRAKLAGKITVLGGASVSGSPELYPEFDYLHLGEMGDGTDRLIACLDEGVTPPLTQTRFETTERVPLCDFPLPAYDLVRLDHYLIGSVQFSSGLIVVSFVMYCR
jgi:hypothetical protein